MCKNVKFDDSVFESLYNINKHARKYAEMGTKNYNDGKKATAKANSVKKKALYKLKSEVLKIIQSTATKIALHTIRGKKYYCFYFNCERNDWSFHVPINEVTVDNECIDERSILKDFNKQSEKEHSSKSLKDSLLHIENEFGLNANEYLTQKYINYGYNSYFIGWKYLGDNRKN